MIILKSKQLEHVNIEVRDEFYRDVWHRVYTQTTSEVKIQVGGEIRDLVGNYLWLSVLNPIRSQSYDNLRKITT